MQTSAETDFLDGEVLAEQRQFLFKRNHGFLAHAQGETKEVGEGNTHIAGAGRIEAVTFARWRADIASPCSELALPVDAASLGRSPELSSDLAFARLGAFGPTPSADPSVALSQPTGWTAPSLALSAKVSDALAGWWENSAATGDALSALADVLARGHDWCLCGNPARQST